MKKKPAQVKKIKKVNWLIPIISSLVFLVLAGSAFYLRKNIDKPSDLPSGPVATQAANLITLPAPALKSNVSVEAALKSRRTKRAFLDKSLSLSMVSQMLWAAQGVTVDWGGRTSPSAKSTYPLNVYLVANKVDGLNPGEYVYIPGERTPVHGLKPIAEGEFGKAIFTSLNQNAFKDVPAMLVITGDMAKMAAAFGGIAQDKDVYLEAGHAAQNLYLQAETLKIGMVTNSLANDSIIRNIISIPDTETIIYVIPFGFPKD